MCKDDRQDSQFSEMISARLSRRHFLAGSAAASAGAFLALNPVANAVAALTQSPLLNFTPIAASVADSIIVPPATAPRR
ncbi:twin-arginine translocation signal domain-containing protein [Edwardsiella ictaluri]|nr:twin-arginine translocation signal domain-containing protein [Edwardsiella ictaluri]WFO11717.1 twin-arginine translocation signal domain-containing protein [Edwardsiella ictaluri]